MNNKIEFRFLRYLLIFDFMLLPVLIFINWIIVKNIKTHLKFLVFQTGFILLYFALIYYIVNHNKDVILTKKELKVKPFGSYFGLFKKLDIPFKSTIMVERFSSPSFGVGMRVQYKDDSGSIRLHTIIISLLNNYENFLKNYFVRLPDSCTVIGFKKEIKNLNKYLKSYQIK